MTALSPREQNRIKVTLIICLVIGVILIAMSFFRRERPVVSVEPVPVDENNNQVREPGDYTVKY